MFEIEFPILKRKVNGRRLVYLDNASTTQKPESVLRVMDDFYRRHNANIHRGIHTLSQEATSLYEGARDKAQRFINAKHREEIIFTSGATEAINLVVWTWGHENIHRGDEILLTEMEHHSNLVPWQILAKKKGAKLRFMPIISPLPNPPPRGGGIKKKFPSLDGRGWGRVTGALDLSNLNKLLTRKTRIVSIAHISNVLGTINPIEKIVRMAHKVGAVVLVDGAQAGAHLKIDVQKLGVDFYVLSGHKMYGPTGVGILYGHKKLLEAMPPYQYGGHMIKKVGWQSSTWAELPHKFEAGTANIAEVIGLGVAVDFLSFQLSPLPNPPPRGEGMESGIGTKKKFPSLEGRGKGRVIDAAINHETELTNDALKKLKQIPGMIIYGPNERGPVVAFNIKGLPPHDLASLLDEQGIAIRTGHHCAMPLHKKLGIESSARVSFALYNTKKDIDELVEGIRNAIKVFGNLIPALSDIGEGERER